MRTIKFRVWDEKHSTWDNFSGIILYPSRPLILQGRILQQYTGTKDVNGIEVYEGDVVEYFERLHEHGDRQMLTAEVFYCETEAAFVLGKNGVMWSSLADLNYSIFNIKITGNIFNNA